MGMTKLEAGAEIQYRKVGRAILIAPAEEQYAERGWWSVRWIKAPKSYMNKNGEGRLYWIDPSDLV